MADEKLLASLQLSVLATLCFDGSQGAIIAAQIKPEHFDELWRDFAGAVIRYRLKYKTPPGENYVEDLAATATLGRKDPKLFRDRLLPQLYAEADGLNAAYAASRVQEFIRRQNIKAALFAASDRFQQDNETMVEEVEGILHKALRSRAAVFSPGTFLNDPKALTFVDNDHERISLGIPELDRLRVGLMPKQILLYIAAKGAGKTWFCVHCGKSALMQRHKVVHYSLEMDEPMVIPRYYQALFAVARDSERYNRTVMELDELDRLKDFTTESVKPGLHFGQDNIRKILLRKMQSFGTRFGRLVVKSFPTSSLTIDQLVAHLDYLAEVEDFIPTVMIIDYPKLMRMDKRDLRVALGHTFEELRGIAGSRNLALVAPHQAVRAGIGARRVTSAMASEDISVVQTADMVLAFSRTKEEEQRGLGRLSVEHVREARGGSVILLSQAYDIGQYVVASALMQQAYWDKMRALGADEED